MKRVSAIGASLIFSLLVGQLAASEPTPIAAAGDLPVVAQPIAQVVVPVPSEVFGSLERFSNSNWRLVQMESLAHARPHGDETQIALLLGISIGEGFIAVAARDATELKEIGKAVLGLASALGVQPTVMRRSQSIVDLADKGDWSAVRTEWDAVLPDVQEGMKQIKSEQLSQLVSLGGWLRGTRALTALILQRYSAEDAELLRQPALLDRFDRQLRAMPANERVSEMQEGIGKMRGLVAASGAPVAEQSVRDLAALCDELVRSVVENADRRSR